MRLNDMGEVQRGGNLVMAERMVNGETIRHRNKRSMALSALRSWLFNEMLSARLEKTLKEAYDYAVSNHHEFVTLEHLLYSLSYDDDAKSVFEQKFSIDFDVFEPILKKIELRKPLPNFEIGLSKP